MRSTASAPGLPSNAVAARAGSSGPGANPMRRNNIRAAGSSVA
ncbi:hypothetical protein AB0E59_22015 [Lentzea sp. NPDC034063]